MRDENSIAQKLEALLTVAIEPISVEELADVLGEDSALVRDELLDLQKKQISEKSGFVFAELAEIDDVARHNPRPV